MARVVKTPAHLLEEPGTPDAVPDNVPADAPLMSEPGTGKDDTPEAQFVSYQEPFEPKTEAEFVSFMEPWEDNTEATFVP